ncbi:hypothetical protein HAX54_037768 [Datura stramonium]|uniref:Uncharacterized protein n=1 Tax=Datura stramonium TaxID=4076 RepID=A0ABS8RMN9_DATST|nr:hypothetical protein [Datura stramonium]
MGGLSPSAYQTYCYACDDGGSGWTYIEESTVGLSIITPSGVGWHISGAGRSRTSAIVVVAAQGDSCMVAVLVTQQAELIVGSPAQPPLNAARSPSITTLVNEKLSEVLSPRAPTVSLFHDVQNELIGSEVEGVKTGEKDES